MARRKESGIELIASLPWPFGIAGGVVAFVLIRYGIGWYFQSSHNPVQMALARSFAAGTFAPLAWMVLGIFWLGALISFLGRRKRQRLLDIQTSLDSLRAMSWLEFELLVGEAFRRQGYAVEETGQGGADGGVDLVLRKHGTVTLVQCKLWRKQRVDVKVVREMFGVLVHQGAAAAKIVCVGEYTPAAQRFAQDKPIELVGGEALLALVQGVQERLPNEAATTAPTRAPSDATPVFQAHTPPDCPHCGQPMVTRANRSNGQRFWGCAAYPACRGTRPA